VLTPLPGSEDHKVLSQQGAWMDGDLNKYDLYHRVTHHSAMPDDDWDGAYRAAWESFYSADHIRTVLRRAAANPAGRPSTTLTTLLWFKLMTMFEGIHPLEGGAFRRKARRDRRHGLPRESPLLFYPRCAAEILVKAWRYWGVYREAKAIYRDVMRSPERWSYSDLSLTPPDDAEYDTLDLYRSTSGGAAAVARKRREEMQRGRLQTVGVDNSVTPDT
jgi:hypothetical protein